MNVERFLSRAHERGADAIQLDLEDSIAPADKADARGRVEGAVARLRREGRSDILVRINQPLEDAVRDLEVAVIPGVDAIMVTKVEGPDHLRLLDELVSRLEMRRGLPQGGIRFLALIEAPGPWRRPMPSPIPRRGWSGCRWARRITPRPSAGSPRRRC
ncbi:aldolase/citrate lyase family protein [Pseudoroseomonas wenyumeiae]